MDMSEQDTFEKVKSIVVEQLGVDEKEVKRTLLTSMI